MFTDTQINYINLAQDMSYHISCPLSLKSKMCVPFELVCSCITSPYESLKVPVMTYTNTDPSLKILQFHCMLKYTKSHWSINWSCAILTPFLYIFASLWHELYLEHTYCEAVSSPFMSQTQPLLCQGILEISNFM